MATLLRRIWEGITPQDEEAQRRANANLARANQAALQAKNSASAAGRSVNIPIDTGPVRFNSLKAGITSAAQSPRNLVYGGARSLVGSAQGVSGLYDLLSPGYGNNRFTTALDKAGAKIDQQVAKEGLSPLGYKISQATGDVAQFLAPSAIAKGLSKASKGTSAVSKGAKFLSSTEPMVDKVGLRYLTKPSTALNALVGTTKQQGYRTAKGQDVSLQTVGVDAALNLGGGKLLDAAGNRIVQPLVNRGLLERTKLNQVGSVGKGSAFDSVSYAKSNEANLLGEYKKRFPNAPLNTDNVREVFDGVGYNRKNAADYHEGASHLSNLMFKEQVKNLKPGDEYTFLAGSSGAGKSAVLAANPDLRLNASNSLDGNFSSASALKKLDEVIKAGAKPKIEFVYRDPAEAWDNGVLRRAADPNNGRVVPQEVFANNLVGARDTVLEAYKKYGDKIKIEVWDNNYADRPKMSSDPIAFLKGLSYNKDDVIRQITEQINRALKEGRIDQETARQLQGRLYRAGSERSRPIPSGNNQVRRTPQIGQTTTPSDLAKSPTKKVQAQLPEGAPASSKQKPPKISETSSTTPKLNVNKFNVSQKAKKALSDVQEELKAEVEKARGAPLTKSEIKKFAEESRAILQNPTTRDAIKRYNAEVYNLRQDNAALLEKRAKGTLTDKEAARLNEGLLKQFQAASAAGRQLQALSIDANPKQRTVLDVMLRDISKKTDDIGAALEASKKLGANPTPQAQAEFYRTFVKATKEDWLDKFRYTNMLSSPLTHIVNVSSNLSGVAGVSPVQKVYEGAVDAARSFITGGPRTRYAGEAASFYKGAAKAFPEAAKKFKDVMTGKEVMGNPDFDALRNVPLATKGAKGVTNKILGFVPKLLEASDQFATTLAEGGERAGLGRRVTKGISYTPKQIEDMVSDTAKYRVFRQEMNKQGQGHFLNFVDFVPGVIRKARTSDNPYVRNIAKFTFPFINTPTNIFKQGLEYSPLGVLTLHGNTDKTAQAAKMLMGTTATTLAAATFAANDAITFGEPTDSKQRDAFRAEGKQPYSIKIGNKWYSYAKTHPAIAFNFAIVAGYKDAMDKGSVDQSGLDKAASTAVSILGFFRDQSYMKSVGDLTSILQAKDGSSWNDIIANQATNTINQVVPFRAAVSWIGRMMDPTQRKVDYSASTPTQIWQGIVKDIPKLNQNVPVRINPYNGQPLMNDNPILNSFSPVRVTNDKGYGNTTGLNVSQRQYVVNPNNVEPENREAYRRSVIEDKYKKSQQNKEKQAVGESNTGKVGQYKSTGEYYATIDGEVKPFKTKEAAQKAVDKQDFEKSDDNFRIIGNTVWRKDAEGVAKAVPKDKYEYDLGKATLTAQKNADDVQGWIETANKQLSRIQERIKNPNTDPLDAISLMNDAAALQKSIDTYKEYGGFKKPKKAKKPKKVSFKTASIKPYSAPKISGIRVSTPKFGGVKTRKLSVSKIPTNYSARKLA